VFNVQGNIRKKFFKFSGFVSVTEFIIKVYASNTTVCSENRRQKKLARLLHMLKDDLNWVLQKYGAIS
jgi:hypothetical protein